MIRNKSSAEIRRMSDVIKQIKNKNEFNNQDLKKIASSLSDLFDEVEKLVEENGRLKTKIEDLEKDVNKDVAKLGNRLYNIEIYTSKAR